MSDRPLTPDEQKTQALKDALALLAAKLPHDAGADELCDRIVRLTEPGRCRYRDCGEKSDCLVAYREVWYASPDDESVEGAKSGDLVALCQKHAVIVSDHGNPEYYTSCPNCGTGIPIN